MGYMLRGQLFSELLLLQLLHSGLRYLLSVPTSTTGSTSRSLTVSALGRWIHALGRAGSKHKAVTVPVRADRGRRSRVT